MKTTMNLCLFAATLILVSCSGGEPSVKDISNALEKAISEELAQSNNLAKGLGANAGAVTDMLNVKITDVEKVSCTEPAKDTYNCNIRYRVSGGMLGSQGRDMASPVNMMRTNNGWMISK